MRLATAPGRPARPAPPGNNDPCEERRTIPEGMPRLPREALMMRLQTGGSESSEAFGEGGQRTAITGPGQKSHVERRKGERASRLVRRTSHCKPRWLSRIAHIDRGHGPVVRNERKAGSFARACRSMGRPQAGHGLPIGVRRKHPSATGAPHAPREGAAKWKKGKWSGEGRKEK